MADIRRPEYDDFKRETRSESRNLRTKVDNLATEVAGLRADIRLISRIGAGLLTGLSVLSPLLAVLLNQWLAHR